MSVSLLVAFFTLLHVTDWSELKDVDADIISSLSVDSEFGGSAHRMPERKLCLMTSFVAAMSSGSSSFSGDVVPVGWRDNASAALCFTPAM